MNSQVICSQESPIFSYNLSPFPNQTSKRLNLEPCSLISWTPHLKNQSFYVKKSHGSRKSRTMAALKNNMCVEQTESFYEMLGISESVPLSEIKKAYKQMAKKYHPDVSPADRREEYTHIFVLVQEAYETLSDPQTRALYDRDLSRGFHFSFTAGRSANYDKGSEWKYKWESQLNDLKRKSNCNTRQSWGAKMRSQNGES